MNAILTLAELLPEAASGAAGALPVRGLALDTRELRPGDVFLALQGAREHGLRHLPSAIERGASAVLVEQPWPAELPQHAGVPLIGVERLRARAGELADRVYAAPSAALDVVGVTGTNGKTSTVQFIAQASELLGVRAATQGTLGAGPVGALQAHERTTPDVCATHRFLAAMRAQGCTLAAMEVSSHALDQGRVDGVRFAVAVFTQLTRDHLDYHGTMEAYFAAKARLFAWPALRAAVINIDCPWGRRLPAQTHPGAALYTYSARADAEARVAAEAVQLDHEGLRFTLRCDGERHPVRTRLLGRFNVDNALAAAASLIALGHSPAAAAAALAGVDPVQGRMNRLGGGSDPLVVVDYAHTPDAIEKALLALREHAPTRLSVVFGCGGERDRGKRPQMAAAAEGGADRVYLTDDNPRSEDGDQIVADVLPGFAHPERVQVLRDRRQAIAAAIAAARAGEIVLIAGKGHEPYQEIAGQKLPFDDRRVAAECLARRAA